MQPRIKTRAQGAVMVEAAIGFGVFLFVLFGCINLSLYIAQKLFITRALDRVLEEAVSDPRFREDTHLAGADAGRLWGKVNAARADAMKKGEAFLSTAVAFSSLTVFKLVPGSSGGKKEEERDGGGGGGERGNEVLSRLTLLRPGKTSLGAFNAEEEWVSTTDSTKKIEYTFNDGKLDNLGRPLCVRGSGTTVKRYLQLLGDCPLIASARSTLSLYPFGELSFFVTSVRYSDRTNPEATPVAWTPAVFSTPFRGPPVGTPTNTPTASSTTTPTGSSTPTPTQTRTIPPNYCEGCVTLGDAQIQCDINRPPGVPISECYTVCRSSENGWNPCPGLFQCKTCGLSG